MRFVWGLSAAALALLAVISTVSAEVINFDNRIHMKVPRSEVGGGTATCDTANGKAAVWACGKEHDKKAAQTSDVMTLINTNMKEIHSCDFQGDNLNMDVTCEHTAITK